MKTGKDGILTALAIKRLTYLVLVTVFAFFIFDQLGSTQKYWLVWSACILGLITLGDSFKRRVLVVFLTGLSAALAAWVAGCSAFSPVTLTICLFLITIACVGISLRYSDYFFVAFIINLFAIMSGELPASFLAIMDRTGMIVLGMGLALFFQILFYPYFIRNELQSYIAITIRHLKKLNDEIFSCFLDVEYPDNIYLYERRFA